MSTTAQSPKFYTLNGDLTAYAFACGYVQWASMTGKEIDHWNNGKRIYLRCIPRYHSAVIPLYTQPFHLLNNYKDGSLWSIILLFIKSL